MPKKTALLLSGGGARAAYQAGVIKAIADMTGRLSSMPFPIICGTSAGAINAAVLACDTGCFADVGRLLEKLWLELRYEHVYRTDWRGLLGNTGRLLKSLIHEGIALGRPVALLDNSPLKTLLERTICFDNIARNLQSQRIEAVSITALNYTLGLTEVFFQGGPPSSEWNRWRRQGTPTVLQLQHLLASTAIPTLFPPQRIGRHYYGDGSLRQLSPISPALHLGAEKIMIVTTAAHRQRYQASYQRVHAPTFGQIMGHMLNNSFIDNLENDIERLEQLNTILTNIPERQRSDLHKKSRVVDVQVISPSENIDAIAQDHIAELPRSLRAFLRVTGSRHTDGGVNISTYLLFTKAFCKTLIDLGYQDAMAKRDQLQTFLQVK